MFCYQCQETAGCTGCTRAGVCGKSARTAALQDLLVYVTRGLCQLTTALRNQGEAIIPEDDRLVTENLFVTITNANFDDDTSGPHPRHSGAECRPALPAGRGGAVRRRALGRLR